MTLSEAIAAGDLLETARAYVRAGLSVIPVHSDGSKKPRLLAWTQWGDHLPTEVQLKDWFGRGRGGAIGIPGGPASGNLSVLDFETAEVWGAWRGALTAESAAHADLCPLVRTPGGGAHLYARLDVVTRCVTLADRPDGVDAKGNPKSKTLIETRAHGGQVLAPGSPAEAHKSGRLYTWERTAWADGAPSHVVPLDVWYDWLERAVALTQVERKPRERRPDTRDLRTPSADDPGTDFNFRGTWGQTGLFAVGWEWERDFGDDRGMVRRPGKEAGVSGTVGLVSSKDNGWPLFHCFTSSGGAFERGESASRFGVFAKLEHGGDFKAAAKALRAMGYGRERPSAAPVVWSAPPESAGPEGTGRGFRWSSELSAQEQAEDWIWNGYLPRSAVTLLSALWKIGKTTLLTHLLRACATGGDFLGRPLQAAKVLYVSEEGERHWVRRRDSLGIEDNVGFYLQPFGARPKGEEWAGFIAQLAADVAAYKFDLVIFDTLAKLWPVTEENDPGGVDGALMPLWAICKAGAGVLLIHHLRKSGGSEFTGSRGSGALSAFADILVELVRFDAQDAKCKKRVLRAKGRYEETPDELVIELVNGQYVAVPDMAAGGNEELPAVVAFPSGADRPCDGEEAVIRVMLESPDVWMQSDDIRTALRVTGSGMRNGDVADFLGGLYFKRQVLRRGNLRSKTNPQMFALASRVPSHSAPGCYAGTTSGDEMEGGARLVPEISSPLDQGAERDEGAAAGESDAA